MSLISQSNDRAVGHAAVRRKAATFAAVSAAALTGCGGSGDKASTANNEPTKQVGSTAANKVNSNPNPNPNQAPNQETINGRSLEQAKAFLEARIKDGKEFTITHLQGAETPSQDINIQTFGSSGKINTSPIIITNGTGNERRYIGSIGVELPTTPQSEQVPDNQTYPVDTFSPEDSKLIAYNKHNQAIVAIDETVTFSDRAGEVFNRPGLKAVLAGNGDSGYGAVLVSEPDPSSYTQQPVPPLKLVNIDYILQE